MTASLYQEIRELFDFSTQEGLIETSIPDVTFYHTTKKEIWNTYLQYSGGCLILQGSHKVQVGNEIYECHAGDYVCYSVDTPVSVEFFGTEDTPYLDIRLKFDLDILKDVMDEMTAAGMRFPSTTQFQPISQISPEELRTVLTTLDLLKDPNAIKIGWSAMMKIHCYYLLRSEQGSLLRQMLIQESKTNRISKVVELLKNHYAEPFNIEKLAQETGMSLSSFHAKFRQMTGMTPLQYQKNLRMIHANFLLKSKAHRVSEVAYQVGYESLPQFSREYKRCYGHSPQQDLQIQ